MDIGEKRKFKIEAGNNFDPANATLAAVEDKSYIKISRNTKGFNFDVKIVGEDMDEVLKKVLDIKNQLQIKLELQTDDEK